MKNAWWIIPIFTAALLTATGNQMRQRQNTLIPMLDYSVTPKTDPVTIGGDGRMITTTKLSQEDAKKPCRKCHQVP